MGKGEGASGWERGGRRGVGDSGKKRDKRRVGRAGKEMRGLVGGMVGDGRKERGRGGV